MSGLSQPEKIEHSCFSTEDRTRDLFLEEHRPLSRGRDPYVSVFVDDGRSRYAAGPHVTRRQLLAPGLEMDHQLGTLKAPPLAVPDIPTTTGEAKEPAARGTVRHLFVEAGHLAVVPLVEGFHECFWGDPEVTRSVTPKGFQLAGCSFDAALAVKALGHEKVVNQDVHSVRDVEERLVVVCFHIPLLMHAVCHHIEMAIHLKRVDSGIQVRTLVPVSLGSVVPSGDSCPRLKAGENSLARKHDLSIPVHVEPVAEFTISMEQAGLYKLIPLNGTDFDSFSLGCFFDGVHYFITKAKGLFCHLSCDTGVDFFKHVCCFHSSNIPIWYSHVKDKVAIPESFLGLAYSELEASGLKGMGSCIYMQRLYQEPNPVLGSASTTCSHPESACIATLTVLPTPTATKIGYTSPGRGRAFLGSA